MRRFPSPALRSSARAWRFAFATAAATALAALLPIAGPAHAQVELFRRASQEPADATFRMADINERWVVLERDRDTQHQELLVLSTRDGSEALRTAGMTLPAGTRRPVSQVWDMTMRPHLAGDTLLTFRPGGVLVALALPSGDERWRIALPPRYLTDHALTVTPTHVAWADQDSGLRVFDASTGRLVWQAPLRPCIPGGCVVVLPDGRASALTRDFELVSWDAHGAELTRVPLAPDWGTHTLLRQGDLAVLLGRAAHVVDVQRGALLVESTPSQGRTTGAFVGAQLLLSNDDGVAALDPRTLSPRWRSAVHGELQASTPMGAAVIGENGLLSWLDAQSGHTRLVLGVGQPTLRWAYRGRPSWGVAPTSNRAEPALVDRAVDGRAPDAPPPARGDLILIQDAQGGFAAFVTATAPPPAPVTITGTVRVNGRGRSGLRVQVGAQPVRTGRGGRFRARVRLHGVVRVAVTADEQRRSTHLPCAREAHALVDPGAPSHVQLDAHARDYECDGACNCD